MEIIRTIITLANYITNEKNQDNHYSDAERMAEERAKELEAEAAEKKEEKAAEEEKED